MDDLSQTIETLTRKIAMSRIDSVGKDPKGAVVGWEHAPPRKGERYTVYLGKGRVLRTSPVEDVRENLGTFLIRTANSIYRVEYLRN